MSSKLSLNINIINLIVVSNLSCFELVSNDECCSSTKIGNYKKNIENPIMVIDLIIELDLSQ